MSKLFGQLDAGAADRAEQPAHQALLQVGGDVADEAAQAGLDAVDELAEEADRVGDDVADHVRGLGQDAQQHVLELDDRLDHAGDGVDRLVDEAAVGGLHLVDARVERVARLDVLARQRVDELGLLGVDVGGQLLELAVELGLRLLADLLQVLRELGDVLGDLGLALRDARAGGGQAAADDVGHLADDRVHVGEVLGLALGVEGVDLRRHAHQLVLEPLGAAEDAAVAVVLVGVHALADVVLEVLARGALARREGLVDLAVELAERLGDVGLGALVDALDVGGDLRPLGLVLGLGALLVAERLLERLPARAVHLLQALAFQALRVALGLAEHALLLSCGSPRAPCPSAPWRRRGRSARP